MSEDETVRRALDLLTARTPAAPTVHALETRRSVRQRRRAIGAALPAMGVLAVIGFAATRVAAPDETFVAASAGDDGAATPPSTDDQPASELTCGPGFPGGLTTPGAAPNAGPAPESEGALPGQTVIHWTADDDVFELRRPAGKRTLYGDLPAPSGIAGFSSSTAPGEVRVDVGGTAIGVPGQADLVFTNPSEDGTAAGSGCDVMRLSVWSGNEYAESGLRVADGPRPRAVPVDLGPLVISRSEDAPPNITIGCANARFPQKVGPGEQIAPQPSAAEALDLFLKAEVAATFGTSGWTEFAVDPSAVTYARESAPGSGEYAVIVETSQHEVGWLVDGWKAAGC